MGKIWNTMRWGSRKAKLVLWTIFGLLLLAIVMVVLAVVTSSLLFAGIALGGLWLGFFITLSHPFRDVMAELQPPEESAAAEEKPSRAALSSAAGREAESADADETFGEEETGNELQQYDERQLRRLTHQYRIPKIYHPVVIELMKRERIRQAPAYLWRTKDQLCFLVFEKEARRVDVPIQELNAVTYERGVPARPDVDYEALRESTVLGTMFDSLLPTYFVEGAGPKRLYRKNLYVVGKDIKLTNHSVRAVFELLSLPFVVKDVITESKMLGEYVKSAYRLNILWKDNVLSTKEYKQQIKELLERLAEAEISFAEFRTNIEQMVMRQYITEEYADYYVQQRQRMKMQKL